MTQEELREYARRQPFEPFRVVLTTGTTYDIRHPNLIMIGSCSAMIGITHQPNGTAYDQTIKVYLSHIIGIEKLSVPPSSSNSPAV